jgi:hypothetical protein
MRLDILHSKKENDKERCVQEADEAATIFCN